MARGCHPENWNAHLGLLQDVHDLFGALILQITFATHRYLFRSYTNCFSTDDCIQVLGSLKFTHSVRMPDPKEPTRTIRTVTTTTFNMARDMARALSQQFVWAGLMENAVDPTVRSFRDRGGLWQLTAKGLCVLQDFCVRTEADTAPLRDKFSHIDAIQLLQLDRTQDDDQMVLSKNNVAAIFRIMMESLPLDGEQNHPKEHKHGKPTPKVERSGSISSTLSNNSNNSNNSAFSGTSAPFTMIVKQTAEAARMQLLDNRLLANALGNTSSKRPPQPPPGSNGRFIRALFTTQLCYDWLMANCTVVNRDEAEMIATEFLKNNWIQFQDPNSQKAGLEYSKSLWLVLTAKGKQLVVDAHQFQLSQSRRPSTATTASEDDKSSSSARHHKHTLSVSSRPNSMLDSPPPTPSTVSSQQQNDGTSARLKLILDDAQLRSLFKDFLRANFCEENLDFYIDYSTLRRRCRAQSPALPSQNQKDLLEDAYSIYTTYLAPGASSELNVNHGLRQEMARLVDSMVTTSYESNRRVVIATHSVSQSLRMMLKWLDRVDDHICRLMASDSVPKFTRTPKYRKIMAKREQGKGEGCFFAGEAPPSPPLHSINV